MLHADDNATYTNSEREKKEWYITKRRQLNDNSPLYILNVTVLVRTHSPRPVAELKRP